MYPMDTLFFQNIPKIRVKSLDQSAVSKSILHISGHLIYHKKRNQIVVLLVVQTLKNSFF
jgi:hypothetical protein